MHSHRSLAILGAALISAGAVTDAQADRNRYTGLSPGQGYAYDVYPGAPRYFVAPPFYGYRVMHRRPSRYYGYEREYGDEDGPFRGPYIGAYGVY